ncbi:MAG: PD40 domain-containing protein [Paludibacteraceae bacterium]|nr:PD40 domain-containing protein [Paludibacteraceae bacterium]
MKKIIFILLFFCGLCVNLVSQTRRDGEFLFNEGRYLEAYEVYVKLMNRYPKDYLLKYQAARCLFDMERYEESLLLFEVAALKDIKKANIYLGEIYFSQYRFDEAALAFSTYIESLGEGQDSLLNIYQPKFLKANLGASMIDRVEDIAIIDSVKVHKQHFLSAYRLPRDLGKLDLYYEMYGIPTEQPQGAYYTGRGDKMLFANKVHGDQLDLNASYRLVGGWSEATNLSSVLNTPEDENFPFELPDGVTLYFASKGHNSLGGYDIFLTRYNSTINDYSEPVNIGMPFNSPANDYLYVFDEMTHIGWFATDRFQHPDTVVVYEFVPNHEKVLIKTEDAEYRRLVAQMKVYRKAKLTTEDDEKEAAEIEKKESEINFFVNDGIVYTRMAQFKSEEAKALYVKAQEADKRLSTLMRLLEGKRREFFFSEVEADQNILRKEILDLEAEVRKYKDLVDEYILQTRREEINAILIGRKE